jgi:hypothetical protein
MHKYFLLILLSSSGLSVLLPDTAYANTGLAIALKASAPDISGNWNVSAGNGRNAAFSFTQNSNKLKGVIRGLPFGDLPVSGTITNSGRVSFSGKFRGMKLTFTGTVSGETMSGTADMPMGNKGGWTATR